MFSGGDVILTTYYLSCFSRLHRPFMLLYPWSGIDIYLICTCMDQYVVYGFQFVPLCRSNNANVENLGGPSVIPAGTNGWGS